MATTYNYYLGKGMKEPCSPNREVYVFGADLSSCDMDDWNCLPNIWDEASTYDLSGWTQSKEVLVALVNIDDTAAGTYYFNFKWYKDGIEDPIRDDDWEITVGAGSWCYSYQVTGWVAGEIVTPGAYHVTITITGAGSSSDTLNFTVTNVSDVGEPGHIWTALTGLYWLNDAGSRVAITLPTTGETGTAGYLWVEGNYLHHIDANGDERRYDGEDCGLESGSVPGHIWIDWGFLYFIDASSHKRRIYASCW